MCKVKNGSLVLFTMTPLTSVLKSDDIIYY